MEEEEEEEALEEKNPSGNFPTVLLTLYVVKLKQNRKFLSAIEQLKKTFFPLKKIHSQSVDAETFFFLKQFLN